MENYPIFKIHSFLLKKLQMFYEIVLTKYTVHRCEFVKLLCDLKLFRYKLKLSLERRLFTVLTCIYANLSYVELFYLLVSLHLNYKLSEVVFPLWCGQIEIPRMISKGWYYHSIVTEKGIDLLCKSVNTFPVFLVSGV